MTNFLITWFIISLIMGLTLNLKINGESIYGIKRFIFSFIIGLPITLILGLAGIVLMSAMVVVIIALVIIKALTN